MATSQCHVGMGCDPARIRESAHPGLHVVDGVHDLTADRLAGIGLSRLLPRGGSSAKQLVGPARRVGQPAPGPGRRPRGVRRLGGHGHAGHLADHRGGSVCRSRDRGWQPIPGTGRGGLLHPCQRPGRHGARRDVGRGLRLRGGHLRRRSFFVRLLLRRHRGAAVPLVRTRADRRRSRPAPRPGRKT